MAAHSWVCRDPAQREKFLACVRKRPRITMRELALALEISVTTVFSMLYEIEAAGEVCSTIDPKARRTPKSSPPRVVWIGARRAPRIGKPKIPRPFGFSASAAPYPARSVAPTGTHAQLAGAVQVLAIAGRLA